MLKLKDVELALSEETLLRDVNFTLSNGGKAALIGPNGCGKTTLLKAIMGEVTPSAGRVTVENEQLGYLPQELAFPGVATVGDFLDSLVPAPTERWRVEKILSQLGFDDPDYAQKIETLSGGELMKLKLAEILIHQPTLLILDEPTNHLDIEGILWFEKLISELPQPVLMVTHDRAFLDRTVGQILEVDEKTVHIYPGNYSAYKAAKSVWLKGRERDYKLQEARRRKLETLLRNARRIKDGKSRGRAVESAKKRMQREVINQERSAYRATQASRIDFAGQTRPGKLILKVDELTHRFGRRELFTDLSFEIRGREKVWLFGENGAGKTTLLNIIAGKISPSDGTVRVGVNVRWAYFKQNQAHLPLAMRVEDFLSQEAGICDQRAHQLLTRCHFPQQYLGRKLGQLSPGERARLSLSALATKEYDFLVLDEPTNHLDLWTKEAVEEALNSFAGAILLVSHDRFLVESIGFDNAVNLTGN